MYLFKVGLFVLLNWDMPKNMAHVLIIFASLASSSVQNIEDCQYEKLNGR